MNKKGTKHRLDGQTLRQLQNLLVQHAGKDNPITSTEIAEKLDINDGEANPKTRSYIRFLIKHTYLPIGATSNGYYLIQDGVELDLYIGELNRRIAGIESRISSVRFNYDKTNLTERD